MHKTGLAVWMLAACSFAQVTPEDIARSPNADWLTYAGDYRGTRHSPLKQITTANVSSLVPKWVYHPPKVTKLQVSPLVYKGVMYITAPNEVQALDARTGRLIWAWKDGRATRSEVNRGPGLLGDTVFIATSDCFLTALHRTTGALLWQKQYADTKKGVFCSSAPFAVKDRVLVGTAGGDTGMRGFVAAGGGLKGFEAGPLGEVKRTDLKALFSRMARSTCLAFSLELYSSIKVANLRMISPMGSSLTS